jgi:hypothetical protein
MKLFNKRMFIKISNYCNGKQICFFDVKKINKIVYVGKYPFLQYAIRCEHLNLIDYLYKFSRPDYVYIKGTNVKHIVFSSYDPIFNAVLYNKLHIMKLLHKYDKINEQIFRPNLIKSFKCALLGNKITLLYLLWNNYPQLHTIATYTTIISKRRRKLTNEVKKFLLDRNITIIYNSRRNKAIQH